MRHHAPVAQLDRASVFETEGCGFKPRRVHFEAFQPRLISKPDRIESARVGYREIEASLPERQFGVDLGDYKKK